MRFKVLLSKSSSALVTQRNYNLTALVFINTMLGSIFGLMQLIGFLMATCETAVDARNKSMNALKKVRKIKNFNKNISLNFEKKYKKCQKEISYFANSMKNFPNSIDTTRELF